MSPTSPSETAPYLRRQKLPRFLPGWVKDRITIEVYQADRFIQWAGTQVQPGQRLLDAGAGQGRYHNFFSHARYTGVDLAVGDTTWDYSNLDAISNLTQLPFCTNAFDAALCTFVLEHVCEPEQVLTELQRVLKPGGKLYLIVPQSWSQHQKPHDYFRYTSYGLKYLLEKSGLQVEDNQPMGGYFWFLSLQLQNFNFWVFSHRQQGRAWYTWPIRALFGLVFQLLLPVILFSLDGLDPIKDETLGYTCVAVKPIGRDLLGNY